MEKKPYEVRRHGATIRHAHESAALHEAQRLADRGQDTTVWYYPTRAGKTGQPRQIGRYAAPRPE